jgi:hypothetical protein
MLKDLHWNALCLHVCAPHYQPNGWMDCIPIPYNRSVHHTLVSLNMNILAPKIGALNRSSEHQLQIFSKMGLTILIKSQYFMETIPFPPKLKCIGGIFRKIIVRSLVAKMHAWEGKGNVFAPIFYVFKSSFIFSTHSYHPWFMILKLNDPL